MGILPMPEHGLEGRDTSEELKGLVWGCTEIPSEGHLPLVKRPIFWAGISFAIFAVLQWVFW